MWKSVIKCQCMGNASKKLAEKCTILSKDEQPIVAGSFKIASKNSDKIREDDLVKLWGGLIDPRLTQFLSNFLFGFGDSKKNIVDFQRFAELYVFCTRGTIDERTQVLYNSLGREANENIELPYQLVKEFCESIVSTYMKMQRQGCGPEFSAWASKGFSVHRDHVQALAEGLSNELTTTINTITYKTVETWLQNSTLLIRMVEQVFRSLYLPPKSSGHRHTMEEELPKVANSLIPMPIGLTFMPDYPAIIDLSHLVFVSGYLPPDLQKEWRFLFSSNIHGESFSTLLGRIMEQGPSVIIVEDTNGYIFGGYCPSTWTLSPNFVGDESSFLFTLSPKMRVFPSTGYNDHYQYLNLHQQTMPNGLMMGGQFQFCGLWIDSDYGAGHSSESCTTYKRYVQMSKDKNFTIKNLEVWGVGEKPVLDEEEKPTSVLDGNIESKAILRLAGHEEHSQGIREDVQ